MISGENLQPQQNVTQNVTGSIGSFTTTRPNNNIPRYTPANAENQRKSQANGFTTMSTTTNTITSESGSASMGENMNESGNGTASRDTGTYLNL